MRKSLNNIEIPKIKGKDSLYRYVGIIGSTLTFFQSILWSVLCLIALIFFAVGGSVEHSAANPYLALYSVNMANMYFNTGSQSDSFLSPVLVCVLVCAYLVASVNLVVASVYIFKVFRKWNKTKSIMKATQYWTISAVVMFAIEFVTFLLFFIDYLKLSKTGGILGAGPATLMTIASKGWLMSFFNLAFALILIFLHYCIKSRPL
ncbi:hypothetical protein CBL_11134 [Carabus blaptoides fortunei]